MGMAPPDVQPADNLPGTAVPGEDVEVIGEKINYKVALNPEIFYRYSIFRARFPNLRLAHWNVAVESILGVSFDKTTWQLFLLPVFYS
jgi:hypothetical protein